MSNEPLLWSYLFQVLVVGRILLVYGKRQREFYKSAILKYHLKKYERLQFRWLKIRFIETGFLISMNISSNHIE